MDMGEIQHGEMLPMNYLKIFFRRKELFIIPAFIGLIFGVCTGLVLPKKYISSTILMVEEGKSDNPLFDQLAVSSTVGQRMTAIRESMLGWNSLVQLTKRLNMDKDIKTPQELEFAVLGIRKDMMIRMRGQNILELSYIGDEPERTRDVVKNITEIFIERNIDIQNKETSDAIVFIEEQLKLYRGKIKSAEIAQLKDNLKTLLLDSTEQHPRVKELREVIIAKEDELRKENLEYTEDVTLDEQTVNPIINDIRAALDDVEGTGARKISLENPEKDYYKVLLVDTLDKVMARDVGVNNSIYNMLLQRLETAKITQRLQSSKEGTKYTILDPPRVPLRPVRPNKVLVAIGGLMVGSLLGFVFVIATEFLDKSFIDVEEANQFFGVPLLGAISKIQTEESVRRQKERQVWMYSLTFAAGVVIIILTNAVGSFLK